MIKYTLTCKDGHKFDSWFSGSADFDRLSNAGLLSCAVCGSSTVEKALMAPQVSTDRAPASGDIDMPNAAPAPGPLSAPASAAEQAVRALRARIEANAEDVGRDFSKQARAMHAGDTPERPIYGEARGDEARALIEDGIPIAPLPWRRTKAN